MVADSSAKRTKKAIIFRLSLCVERKTRLEPALRADILAANKAQEKLTKAFADLGAVGEPILTAIKTKVADMVTAAVPHIQNLIQKVKDMKKWIKDNQNTVDAWAAVIIAATVSVASFLLVLKWSAIMSAATKAIKGTRAAILLFNTALRANPIGLVISLLAGLVAGFVYLWNNNKGFRDFWLSMWSKIKSATGSAVSWIKGKFGDFKSALNTVKTTFGNIKDAIADKLDDARAKVKSAIDKIKGFFKFSWSLPKLKMPSFSMKGKFSLNPPSVPKIGIKWNADGAIFNSPTIFATHQGYQGVGEAGAEAVTPIDRLQDYVRSAMQDRNEDLIRTLIEQNRMMMDFLARAIPNAVRLDSGALVGQLVPAIDGRLSDRYAHAMRGNVR